MPWKLIFYLIIVGLILVFVGLNLGNTTDISLGFITYEGVPVFMGLFVAFFLGVAVSIPVAVQSSSRKTRKRSQRKQERAERKQLREENRGSRGGISRLLPGTSSKSHDTEVGPNE
jgi:uncharacterized oligopeptide transporter (OPT) family protein